MRPSASVAMLLAMWLSPSRGSCHPRDTLVACHHMGWVRGGCCRWCLHVWCVVVVAFRCSLSWLCGCHLTRGLLLAVRWCVVMPDGGLPVMGFTSGSSVVDRCG